MTFEELQILVNIYNNLLKINTKGEDSFIMVDNLRKLYDFIMIYDQKIFKKQQEEEQGNESK